MNLFAPSYLPPSGYQPFTPMSHRHLPRQPDRDSRLHEQSSGHPHPLIVHPSHPQAHPSSLNGNGPIPTTPGGMSNGSAHNHANNQLVSPSSVPAAIPNGASTAPPTSIIHKLTVANEQTWLLIGRVAEQMGDLEHALSAYENALRHNPMSLSGLTQVAGIARIKENYPKAVEYFQRVLSVQEENGEVWSALGHCYLMQDDLQKAYSAYQQALYLLPNPKEDPKLWYGIGILYDRYGSLDHAEEAFASVLRMDKELDFDKANEILFRLGIIYKQQGKYDDSLRCFDRILRNPPSPLAHADIWFQIGHVYEQQKDHLSAKDAYERVVADNPHHAKVLQQLGWLYHQDGSSFQNQDLAIQYLTKSLEADPSDAQSWYLLGRAYMAGQKYNKAYEAYQQAVYRDGRNPTFWCSIGVLYFQINQFRDALDAYSRAIRINPYISEVWFDLGSLYESCNNQISDAIDAYARASELDPSNPVISRRLELLKTAQATGGQLPAAPGPQDVHPTAYASAVIPPTGLTGPPLLLTSTPNTRTLFRTDSRGPSDASLPLPPPPQVGAGRSSPGPFRGGPPPPVILDESRHVPSHTPLAPMDVDRPPHHARDFSGPGRDGPTRGPIGHQNLLLHHPVPQQQLPTNEIRNAAHGSGADAYLNRPLRVPSTSISPPPHHSVRGRSPPPPPFQGYPPATNRQPVGPAQPSQRSPLVYSQEPSRPVEQDMAWDRRAGPSNHHREWEHERRPRQSAEYAHPSQQSYYPPPSPGSHQRGRSPSEPSPRSAHPPRPYWESKPPSSSSTHGVHGRPSPPPMHDHPGRRYDPRFDARDQRDHDREVAADHSRSSYGDSPEGLRNTGRHAPSSQFATGSLRGSESPRPTPTPSEPKERRRRTAKDKDTDIQPAAPGPQDVPQKKERKKRTTKRAKEDQARMESPKPFAGERAPSHVSAPFRIGFGPQNTEVSSNGSSSSANRSGHPSPVTATPRPPSRVVDEDYDEGVADALMGLASYRAPDMPASQPDVPGRPSHSPTVSAGSRASPRPHRGSVSSTRSRPSPPSSHTSLKRPLSPGPDEMGESKRSRMDTVMRRVSSPSAGRRTPVPSTRPSPIPFRTQPPASHSPEARQESRQQHDALPYPPSPPLPAVLPPHPRPIGAGLAHNNGNNSGAIALPPIATLSPASTAPSPAAGDERMQVDNSRSVSPPSRSKLSEVIHPGSPATKGTPSPASSGHAVEKSET